MGGLFGKKPEPAPVQRMPDVEDPSVVEARRRAAADAQARSGRTSTVLSRNRSGSASTAPGTQGGTQAYRNSLLGQAG